MLRTSVQCFSSLALSQVCELFSTIRSIQLYYKKEQGHCFGTHNLSFKSEANHYTILNLMLVKMPTMVY